MKCLTFTCIVHKKIQLDKFLIWIHKHSRKNHSEYFMQLCTKLVFYFSVSPKSFLFISVPSVNATLGEKVELKCSVNKANSTKILDNIAMHSRTTGSLNATCSIFDSSSGECSYTIPKVELWHRGTYDCIIFYKGIDCFTRTLDLSVLEPRRLAIVSLHSRTNKVSPNQGMLHDQLFLKLVVIVNIL